MALPAALRIAGAGRRGLFLLAGIGLALSACADRERLSPLDPRARNPLDLADPLDALAGDGRVELRWDFTRFDDVARVRLSREGGGAGVVRDVDPARMSFVDEDVVNGVLYRYRLALQVEGQGEGIEVAGEPFATPGPERGWVADAGMGLVYRLTPDGRRALFAQGRFPAIAAIALDPREGTCWVSDGRLGVLWRIAPDGALERVGAALSAGGALAIDGDARRGFVAEADGHAVYAFAVAALVDTVELAQVDATFRGPVRLAPSPGGGVWIADAGADRVLLFDAGMGRVGQWHPVDGIVDLAAAGVGCCQAWVLAARGKELLRLTPGEPPLAVALPFAEGRGLDGVDDGGAWVVGETDIAAFDAGGRMQLVWREAVSGGRALAVDERNGQVWAIGDGALLKAATDQTHQTQLTGFTRAVAVAVDPGP